MIETAASNTNTYRKRVEVGSGGRTWFEDRWVQASPARWKGNVVSVEADVVCPAWDHELEVVHHYGECEHGGLVHFCPTGFLMCSRCGGFADEPEPHECTRNGY